VVPGVTRAVWGQVFPGFPADGMEWSGALLCLALGAGSLPLWAQAPARAVTPTSASESGIADPKLDARVESLLRSMTLEEKIGSWCSTRPARRLAGNGADRLQGHDRPGTDWGVAERH